MPKRRTNYTHLLQVGFTDRQHDQIRQMQDLSDGWAMAEVIRECFLVGQATVLRRLQQRRKRERAREREPQA